MNVARQSAALMEGARTGRSIPPSFSLLLVPAILYPPAVGVVKDWLLIAFSWSVIMDKVTTVNLLGYLLAFLGVCWYNHTKLQVRERRG